MSNRYQGGFITASYNGLKLPDAPTIGTATAGGNSASVTFTAPVNVGGGAITGYTVTSSPGGFTGTGTSSPITVSGLTNGTAYTFTVTATNAYGTGPASAASNSVTPVPTGQQAYTNAGTFTWVAPTGVTSVSIVAVSGGCGDQYGPTPDLSGSGGNLGYKNNYTVTPGNSYTVVVGAGSAANANAPGGNSSFDSAGGGPLVYGGTVVTNTSAASTGVTGGGRGGNGVNDSTSSLGSGAGGAGGYSGNGGNGTLAGGGTAGAGGGGGGGAWPFGNGGGVGILGEGASGAAGGQPGSGGVGQFYGGGGAGNNPGAKGAVRIIWPGTTRLFPSTNTGDL